MTDLNLKINSQGGSGRSAEEIMKKWKDLKSQTKKKEQTDWREMKKTGGGGAICSLKDWEDKIITVIPNSVLEGIEGGLDLFQKNKVTNEAVLESAETVIQVGGEKTVYFTPVVYMFREKSCREVKKKTWIQKKEG